MKQRCKFKFNFLLLIAISFAMFFGAYFVVSPQKVLAYDENYEACILDENLEFVQNFEFLEDALHDNILSQGYTIKILKNEVTLQNAILIDFDLTMSSDEQVTIFVENFNGTFFEIKNSANFVLNGDITFQGKNTSEFEFLKCENNANASLDNVTIKNFDADMLFENYGEISLFGVKIVENLANLIINNQNFVSFENVQISNNTADLIIENDGDIEICDTTISNNFLISSQNQFLTTYAFAFEESINSSQSFVFTKKDFALLGTQNNLDITMFLDRTGENNCKVIRQNPLLVDYSTGNIKIVLCNNNTFLLGDIIVQTAQTDALVYTLLGVPKINNSVDTYFLNNQEEGLVVRGRFFDVEYYINSSNGTYETFANDTLPAIFEYDANLAVPEILMQNYSLVGWFGFDTEAGVYFDKDCHPFSSIFNSNLNNESSIVTLANSLILRTKFYSEPNVNKNTYGKLHLYSKWNADFSVSVETETITHEYIESSIGGAVKFNNTQITSTSFTKTITIGTYLSLSAKAYQNYVFVGWFTKNGDIYTKYKFENYIFGNSDTVFLTVDNLYFDVINLVARFAYDSSAVSLQKMFIDEKNSNEGYDILANNEYLQGAKLIRNGEEYEGIEYVNFVGSQILLRNGDELQLQINPDINYKLYAENPVSVQDMFYSNKSIYAKYEFIGNKYLLTIKNNNECGIFKIILNFQKNNNVATLKFGTNDLMNNFIGANVEFETSVVDENNNILQPVFNLETHTASYGSQDMQIITSKTCNVYFGTDIVLMFNTFDGYRFEMFNALIEYQSLKDIETVVYEYIYLQGTPVGIKIFNVIDNINISFMFSKVYKICIDTNTIDFDGQPQKLGQVRAESDNFSDDSITKVIKEGASIYCETKQILRQEDYIFKNWVIKTSNGEIANLDILRLTSEDLKNMSLTIYDIYEDLFIEAIYGKITFDIDIICADTNGTVEVVGSQSGTGYFWEVEYGDDISFRFTPKNNMYIFEIISCTDDEAKQTQSTYFVLLELKNITANHRIEIQFAPDTVYRHMTTTKLEGDGSYNSPYLIKSAGDLALASYYVNTGKVAEEGKMNYADAYFKLTDDIELNEKYFFVPIGTQQNAFNGVFDYNYHTVSNIVVENINNTYLNGGLLGVLNENARIIKQFKSTLPLIIGGAAIAFIVLLAFLIVYRIEKKRQKPKKVFVLNVLDDENKD